MADINLLKKLVDDDSNKDELAFKVNKDNYVSKFRRVQTDMIILFMVLIIGY